MPDDSTVTFSREFAEPFQGVETGMFQIFESTRPVNVRVLGEYGDTPVNILTTLSSVERNKVYTLQVTNINSNVAGAFTCKDWEEGKTTSAIPSTSRGIFIDKLNSIVPEGVDVNYGKNVVTVPCSGAKDMKLAFLADTKISLTSIEGGISTAHISANDPVKIDEGYLSSLNVTVDPNKRLSYSVILNLKDERGRTNFVEIKVLDNTSNTIETVEIAGATWMAFNCTGPELSKQVYPVDVTVDYANNIIEVPYSGTKGMKIAFSSEMRVDIDTILYTGDRVLVDSIEAKHVKFVAEKAYNTDKAVITKFNVDINPQMKARPGYEIRMYVKKTVMNTSYDHVKIRVAASPYQIQTVEIGGSTWMAFNATTPDIAEQVFPEIGQTVEETYQNNWAMAIGNFFQYGRQLGYSPWTSNDPNANQSTPRNIPWTDPDCMPVPEGYHVSTEAEWLSLIPSGVQIPSTYTAGNGEQIKVEVVELPGTLSDSPSASANKANLLMRYVRFESLETGSYTTDGSDPTRESELYTEPIFLTSNCTYKAVAFADGLYDSAVSEFTVSNLTMMMPAAACEHNTLILTVWDEMASIWYTTDPDAPHEDMDAWTLYTEPVVLTQDCTVRFFARRSGFLDSPIATYDFVKEDPTGVDTVGSAGLGVRKEAGKVVVYSDRAASVPVYTLDGKIVKVVNVVAGRNVINGLDSNIYIIGNVRIKI